MRYRYILLDFDGTILNSKKLERFALKKTFEDLHLIFSEQAAEIYHRLNRKYWAQYETGEITQAQLRIGRTDEFFRICDISDVNPALFADTYLEYSGVYTPMFDGAEKLLKSLSGTVKLYMVTNGFTDIQNKKIDSAGIRRWFEGIFIAQELGAKKPEHTYFQKVYDSIGSPDKGDMLIVGDSLNADIKGGADFGIDTCWFNPEGHKNQSEVRPTFIFDSLDKILLMR